MSRRLVTLSILGFCSIVMAAGCDDRGVVTIGDLVEAAGGEANASIDQIAFLVEPLEPNDQPAVDPIDALIDRYFGIHADDARDIVWCESRRDVDVISRTNDYGLFQINRPSHEGGLVRDLGYTMNDMLTPEPNVHVAWELFNQSGLSWRPWSCARLVGLS